MGKWFYANEDKQIGPIEKYDVYDLIEQRVITADTLMWTEGMDEWKKLKDINAINKPSNQSSEVNTIDSNASIDSQEETFFSPEGRLRRKDYFVRILLLSIPGVFFSVLSEGSAENGLIGFLALITICCGIIAAIQIVKRLHDINLSGWLWLISFVPFVNFIFGLYILFKDGTQGPNQYGEDPKDRVAQAA